MPADTLLIILLAALGAAGLPFAAWLRAQRRIHDLETTLLTQTTDAERYEELRAFLQHLVSQTEQLADNQGLLARRLSERVEAFPPPRSDQARPVTPH
jgi:hypothetical protein